MNFIIGEDNSSEVLAQLMYENRRLKNELDSLNRNILGYEENIDSLSSDLQEKEEALKRYASVKTAIYNYVIIYCQMLINFTIDV